MFANVFNFFYTKHVFNVFKKIFITFITTVMLVD